jgi:hypothetical protein
MKNGAATIAWIFLAALVPWTAGRAPAQVPPFPLPEASDAIRDPGLIGSDGKGVKPAALDPQDEAALIDKPRIAEDALDRLATLRETGNPHIRRGLLLAGIQEDPDAVRVDPGKLRADRTRMVEGRRIFSSAQGAEEGGPPSGPRAPSLRPASPGSPHSGNGEIILAVAGVSLLAASAMVFALRH